MNVSASMSAPAVSVDATTTIGEAARCMDLHGVGCLVVTEGEHFAESSPTVTSQCGPWPEGSTAMLPWGRS